MQLPRFDYRYRKQLVCRVPRSLPCANSRAHGKQAICRVRENKHTANIWHTANSGGCTSHLPSAESWTHFDGIHREKAEEARNVRVALATDGFNRHGMSAAPYTCWPVFVIPLNLPPGVIFQ